MQNDANHKQIKQDDQSSSMYMLWYDLGYAFNNQSQKNVEIKACISLRTRYEYSKYHKENLSSQIMKLNLENVMRHNPYAISRINFKIGQV